MNSGRSKALLKALALACAVIAIDQVAKQLAIANVDAGEPHDLILGIQISNVRNPGIAFGLFSDGDLAIVAFTIAILGLLVFYFYRHATNRLLWLPVGLIVGGALANLVDRLRIGEVIDFIDFPAWPAFNFADVAIVAGAVGLALALLGSDARNGADERGA